MNISKIIRRHIDLKDVDLVWKVWHYQLIHACKLGEHLEIRHLHEYADKLANPDTILRIKRKLKNENT